MMTTVGGNVKELCTAASEGKIDIVRYHLDMGMDPNFQHPEFMTTPLIEAARFGQTAVVQLLLDRGKADPTITADFEGCTALEEAMKEGHHDVVDIILPYLARHKNYDCECLVIWVTTGTGMSPVAAPPRALLYHLLVKGHCVLWTVDTNGMVPASSLTTLAKDLRSQTGNQKLFLDTRSGLPEFFTSSPKSKNNVWHPSSVDVWLHRTNADGTALLAKELEAYHKPVSENQWQIPFREDAPRVLLCMDTIRNFRAIQSDVEEVLSKVLNTDAKTAQGHCCVMEPLTWKEKVVYSLWSPQAWCEKVLERLLRLHHS